MNCDEARILIPLFLYEELSFDDEDGFEAHLDQCEPCRKELDREKILVRSFDEARLDVSPEFVVDCRQQLRARIDQVEKHRLSPWERVQDFFRFRWHVPSVLQPLGAVALVALGFFGAGFMPDGFAGRFSSAGLVSSRVRTVEPEKEGGVRIVIEETTQKTINGSLADENVQKLLLSAVRDPRDPGLRGDLVSLLMSRSDSAEVRDALLYALQHDANAGVRLKALAGLKGYAADPEVRKGLTHVMLSDPNPGVRTQVIDLLMQGDQQQLTGVLQELMRKEDNGYVRLRCRKALEKMRASLGTF